MIAVAAFSARVSFRPPEAPHKETDFEQLDGSTSERSLVARPTTYHSSQKIPNP